MAVGVPTQSHQSAISWQSVIIQQLTIMNTRESQISCCLIKQKEDKTGREASESM